MRQRPRATASRSSPCCGGTCRRAASCSRSRAARASTPSISRRPCRTLVFQPSDPDPERARQHRRVDRSLQREQRPAALGLDVTREPWPVDEAAARSLGINMVHISPWSATKALVRGAARTPAARRRPLLYGPYRRDAPIPRRATTPSTHRSVRAIPTGACANLEAGRRSPPRMASASRPSSRCRRTVSRSCSGSAAAPKSGGGEPPAAAAPRS